MICKMCATGADIISRIEELDQAFTDSGQGYEIFRNDAIEIGKEFHHHCPGKYSCDCQHRTQEPGKNVSTIR